MTEKNRKQQGAVHRATTANPPEGFAPLLGSLRQLIADSRQQVLRAVDAVQVQTYWHIGRHIVEFEQGGKIRAAHGKALLATLAQSLTREFGKGFDASNLRYMRLFYQAFPIRDALRHELSWTHYRLLLRVDTRHLGNPSAWRRQWRTAAARTCRQRADNGTDPNLNAEPEPSPVRAFCCLNSQDSYLINAVSVPCPL